MMSLVKEADWIIPMEMAATFMGWDGVTSDG